MITNQKLHAALKKGGHRKAVWERSGSIRGWGEWREGYKIEQGEPIIVSHVTDKWFGHRTGPEAALAYRIEKLKAYQQALERAGIESLLNESEVPRLEIHAPI